ncbi:recombinase family protein [Methylorubrum extorquens]
MLIGYARVSTEDQNLDLQRNALKAAGCSRIFEEKESGRAGTKRPALEAALDFLRSEDQLVVWKIDRLGRSLREMLDTAHMLQERGVKLRSLTEQVDTETATGRMMFNFLGTIAEYFHDLNRERTNAGLKAALARGRKGGRPRKLTDGDLAAGRAMLAAGDIPVAAIAKRLGIGRRTFYEYFPQARAQPAGERLSRCRSGRKTASSIRSTGRSCPT